MSPANVQYPNHSSSRPLGFQFQPSEGELIIEYLKPKNDGKNPPHPIPEIDLYQSSPEKLAGIKGEWFIYTRREKKYPKGKRPNRSAGNGYWKATGSDTSVFHKGMKVGSRKALVFYSDRRRREKTNWMMHEYVQGGTTLGDWVLCKIFKKSEKGTSKGHNDGSSSNNPVAAVQEANGESGIYDGLGNLPGISNYMSD